LGSEIAPKLKAGETLLVAAHGNSLRAIVKLLFACPTTPSSASRSRPAIRCSSTWTRS
jgi:broad specificity phosphatase PhoE